MINSRQKHPKCTLSVSVSANRQQCTLNDGSEIMKRCFRLTVLTQGAICLLTTIDEMFVRRANRAFVGAAVLYKRKHLRQRAIVVRG